MKDHLIGLDIGGSKIEGIFWGEEKILRHEKIKTPKDKNNFFQALFALIKSLSQSRPISGIGIAIAGAIDVKKGMILKSPNLKFLDGVKLGELVGRHFKKAVKMDNDVNCFLRAELRFGQARGKKNVVALTLGTGVGGAVYTEGKLVSGRHGAAGEMGYMAISQKGKKFLTLEDLVSSHGFMRFGVTDPLDCQNRAFAGERKAKAVYDQIGKYLGVGLANLVNIFDPDLIILGGGISRGHKLFLPYAFSEMKKYTMLPPKYLPPVKISKLKYAGALGAVILFLETK